MTHILKKAALAAAGAGLVLAVAAPQMASAGYTHYVCKYEQKHDEHVGTAVGAVAGGVIGSNIAGHGSKTTGTVLGALAGAAIGSKMGHSKGKKDCLSRMAYRTETHYYRHNGHTEKVVYRYVRE